MTHEDDGLAGRLEGWVACIADSMPRGPDFVDRESSWGGMLADIRAAASRIAAQGGVVPRKSSVSDLQFFFDETVPPNAVDVVHPDGRRERFAIENQAARPPLKKAEP